jgi:hypothetical protein
LYTSNRKYTSMYIYALWYPPTLYYISISKSFPKLCSNVMLLYKTAKRKNVSIAVDAIVTRTASKCPVFRLCARA